jgi:hypothetical protein
VIRPGAGLTERAEPFIGADQFLDLDARVGFDQALGDSWSWWRRLLGATLAVAR